MTLSKSILWWPFLILLTAALAACSAWEPDEPIPLRLQVSLTPQELETFEPALEVVKEAHPEWEIILETVPQSGFVEKINAQLAGDDLPDVVRVQGLFVQQWIRQNAFLDLSTSITESDIPLDDFYEGPLSQFRWQDKLWGLPDTAAPDIVFYNKAMFDNAGLSYPTDDWTFEDMRSAAVLLTLDTAGRNPMDPNFDATSIEQWGWNGGLSNYWQRHFIQAFGGDFCVNEDCTQMSFTSADTLAAMQWWATLVNEDNAALYDPYGGSQTGVPGDPFIAGKAAMGFNGFFAVGQLNAVGNIQYDIVQPFLGVDDLRFTPLSTNGYVIGATSEHPDEAFELMQALLTAEFLEETWGKPGHSVPARRSAAASVVNETRAPENQDAILAAMEYGQVFKPYTASAFEVLGKTGDLFTNMMKGDLPVSETMAEIEQTANDILARDR